MKYIIKNCSAYCDVEASMGLEKPVLDTCINYRLKKITQCKDIDDCPLKQIVEKCKQEIKRYEKGDYADELWEQAIGKNDKSEEILKLLEIVECKDE